MNTLDRMYILWTGSMNCLCGCLAGLSFQRIGAERLVMVMPDEWADGKVKVKVLESGEESEVEFDSL